MLHLETSRTGASFIQTSSASNPREIVTRLYEKYPTASREMLFAEFQRLLAQDEAGQRAVALYFFVNMSRNRNRPPAEVGSREQREAAQQRAVNQLKEHIVRVVLLDLPLPDGKLLRHATFAECAAVGGWFAKIAKQGKPRQIVGKVLTEKQLRAIHA